MFLTKVVVQLLDDCVPEVLKHVPLYMAESCGFSMLLEKDGDEEYRDALFDKGLCEKTIGDFIKGLETDFNGTVVDFVYAGYDKDDDLIAKQQDMDMNMTLQQLYDKHGQQEEGTFFVQVVSKKRGVSAAEAKVNAKRIAELEKKLKELWDQISPLSEELNKLKGRSGGARRKSRKNRRS